MTSIGIHLTKSYTLIKLKLKLKIINMCSKTVPISRIMCRLKSLFYYLIGAAEINSTDLTEAAADDGIN